MKKKDGYLKLCNDRFKEESEKLKKRAIVGSIMIAIIMLIVALLIVLLG